MPRKSKPPKPRDPILIEVLTSLGAGHIREASIEDTESRIAGYCEAGKVTINPIFDIVDTLIHELLHRLRPQWSERSVASRTKRLMASLSDKEIARIYELYQGIKKVRKKPIPYREE